MRFKENETDTLYDAALAILVRKVSPDFPNHEEVERLTLDEFVKRFDESNVYIE